jgi:hypothetical protein
VQRWVHALLFYDWPFWVFNALYLSFAAIVALSYVLLPPTRNPPPRSLPQGEKG